MCLPSLQTDPCRGGGYLLGSGGLGLHVKGRNKAGYFAFLNDGVYVKNGLVSSREDGLVF